jgi:hypothetical protein
MSIPIMLWFCENPDQALLNDYSGSAQSQRILRLSIASIDKIVQAMVDDAVIVPNPAASLYAPTTAQIAPSGFTAIALPNGFTISLVLDMYVNSIFVNPDIRDIFASRIGFNLIRVHRRQINNIQTAEGQVLLDQLKYPIEYLTCGFRDRTSLDFDRWHLYGTPNVSSSNERYQILAPAIIWNNQIGGGIAQLVAREAVSASSQISFVEKLGITAQTIVIYSDRLPDTFYNAYLPIRYHKESSNYAIADSGLYFITFCMFPGRSDISGKLHFSSSREIYVHYKLKSDYSTNIHQKSYEMVTMASAFNFLIRKGDRIHLKYAL